MITVTVPVQLRTITGGRDQLYINLNEMTANRTLNGLLDCIEVDAPGFKSKVLDTDGRLKKFLHLFIEQTNAITIHDRRCKDVEEKAKVDGTQPKPPEMLDIPLTGYEDIAIMPVMAAVYTSS